LHQEQETKIDAHQAGIARDSPLRVGCALCFCPRRSRGLVARLPGSLAIRSLSWRHYLWWSGTEVNRCTWEGRCPIHSRAISGLTATFPLVLV